MDTLKQMESFSAETALKPSLNLSKSLNVLKKVLELQKAIPALIKNVKGYNYHYVDGASILSLIRPKMDDLGILLIQESVGHDIFEKRTEKKSEVLYVVRYVFTWVDVETGETLPVEFTSAGCNGDEQGIGSAHTYAERYFLLKFFHIPTDDQDPDALSTKKNQTTQQVFQKKEPTAGVDKTGTFVIKGIEHKIDKKNKPYIQIKMDDGDQCTPMFYIWPDKDDYAHIIKMMSIKGVTSVDELMYASFDLELTNDGKFYRIESVKG